MSKMKERLNRTLEQFNNYIRFEFFFFCVLIVNSRLFFQRVSSHVDARTSFSSIECCEAFLCNSGSSSSSRSTADNIDSIDRNNSSNDNNNNIDSVNNIDIIVNIIDSIE
jgi:hypothetical protein